MKTEYFKSSLTKFLLSAFSADEFRRLVRYLPDGDFLERMLPGEREATFVIISDGVKMLCEHNVINDAS